jgi:hypothetical protein
LGAVLVTLEAMQKDHLGRVDHAMRGLVYWMGWQWNRMGGAALEGAIVAELLGSLRAVAPDRWTVSTEVLVQDLIPSSGIGGGALSKKQRVDLVLHPKNSVRGTRSQPPVLIEVKRRCSPIRDIRKDVQKLSLIRREMRGDPLALLIVADPNSSGDKKYADPPNHGSQIIKRPRLGLGRVCGKRWQHVFPTISGWRGHHAYLLEIETADNDAD